MVCGRVALLGVEIGICWGFRELVWLKLWCILWEVFCGGYVVLVCMVLVD